MVTIALLDSKGLPTEDENSNSVSDSPYSKQVDPLQAAVAAANSLGPAAHEILVHRAVKLSCDRSFNASTSFVHFSQHGLHNVIDDRSFLEAGSVRNLRRRARWYDSHHAIALRKCLRSRIFSAASLAALFVALFFPDLFVLLQVPSNKELDAILTSAFAVFVAELVCLIVCDPGYPMSFFFFMDLLGTVSMFFDISWAFGPDASVPERYSENKANNDSQFIVIRAARAARLGARAGRLSRVVKILRFLHSEEDADHQVKMAKVISNKLSDVLSIRVAFLTICIAVVLPSFQMFEYPEMDESMIAWTQTIVADIQSYHAKVVVVGAASSAAQAAKKRLSKELLRFGRFYSTLLYGPFKVCIGHTVGNVFECDPNAPELDLASKFSAPKRRSSTLEMNEGNTQVFYDMSTPHRMEAGMSIGLIAFIILVMVVFSMVLSSDISLIALTPLERMLSVVRQRCKQIFKYTNDLREDDRGDAQQPEEDEEDENKSSEFALLEKAVSKLVAIAALSAKTEQVDESEMDEHRAVLMGWAQGGQQPKNAAKSAETPASAKPALLRATTRQTLADVEEGSTIILQMKSIPFSIKRHLNTPYFDSLSPNKEQGNQIAAYIVFTLHGCTDYVQSLVTERVLTTFVMHAEKQYPANPFHNFAHALDVLHAMAFSFQQIEACAFLTEAEQFWLSIAALGHDLGHVGVNNQFLVETSHEIALTYNDRSPLENMHCSKLFQIVSDPDANIFGEVERDEYKEMRKGIIHAILHTDIVKHNEMVKELSLLYQMHSQAFEVPGDSAEVLSEHSQVVANALLHCADIGNPMKPWELCYKLAHLCLDEFFAQGDKEKELGIPVQMLNDREKVSRPNSQIGFTEFMLVPMVEAMVQLLPPLDFLALHLGKNIKKWKQAWIEEASPPEDAIEKVKARVQKVVSKCEALVQSSAHMEESF